MSQQIVLIREERFSRSPDGAIWSRWGTGQGVWAPYLQVFPRLVVVARIEDVVRPDAGWTRSDHPAVRFEQVPYFRGPLEYAKVRHQLTAVLRSYLRRSDPLVLRVPSPLANTLWPWLIHRPYGLEVAGDPYDQLSPGALKHVFRPVFRRLYRDRLRRLCAAAACSKYVTCRALQERYPPGPRTEVFAASDVELPPDSFRPPSRRFSGDRFRVVCVGMMESLYKGQDVLLSAAAIMRARGSPVEITFIGDGRYRAYLERLAQRNGISDSVRFRGVSNRPEIERELDASDLFVLSSRAEGLPRAMLEAMARSLPCAGTTAGGIPELLQPEFLAPPNNPQALAGLLERLVQRPELLEMASRRNYEVALRYRLESRLEQEMPFLQSVAGRCGLTQ